jgi:colicin import membrane protein
MQLAASTASGAPDPLRPQRPVGLGRGALLALLVHGGLLLALALGVSWRASEPTGATAELWAAVPEFAAPAAEVPPPQPVEPPPPLPVAKPEPKVDVAPSRDAEIAIEKAKREREREREREQAREREAKAKAEAEKKRLVAQQEEQRKKLAVAAAQAEKAEQERIEKLRQDNLKRIQGQAGATGGPTATGTAARDAGPSDSYAGRIVARVKPNIVLTVSVPLTLRAVVEVRAAPDGTIVGRRVVKSSGNKDWDDAVLRALDRTEILPRDTDGRVPSPIEIVFTP